MAGQSIFITGGNRGIGFELVKQFAANSENTVIATTRNVETSAELTQFASESKNVKVVTLDVSSQESIDALDKQLPKVLPDGLDLFIGNAGISEINFATILQATREQYNKHYNVNTLGQIFVTKILHPYLLKKSTRQIVFISSVAGQIQNFLDFPVSAYGQSKAALNYTAKELSLELAGEGFTVVPVHPGLVRTDMGKVILNADIPGLKEYYEAYAISALASAEALHKLIGSLTKESNGKFYSYKGTELVY